MARVSSGLERLARSGFEELKGRRVGLIANPTSVDGHLRHAADLLQAALGKGLVRLFGPEHGIRGEAQDMDHVGASRDLRTGLDVVSLYGATRDSLRPPPDATADLDCLIFDVQDVGSRYYTFQATMALALEEAGTRGFELLVLDRPNPIGAEAVEGNLVAPGFESFVGHLPIAVRHGLTVGELARYYARHCGLGGPLRVIGMEGYRRAMWFEDSGLPWVLPSPNMPTVDTALVYPGQCLLEGTNLSEGRGTTRPFELSGAPWIDGHRLRAELERADLPGASFRPCTFRPTFHKFAGQACQGVQIHVTDRRRFRPLRTGLALLCAMRAQDPARFAWRSEPYEFVADRMAFDLLAGNERIRGQIEAGASLGDIEAGWAEEHAAFLERRREVLLYD